MVSNHQRIASDAQQAGYFRIWFFSMYLISSTLLLILSLPTPLQSQSTIRSIKSVVPLLDRVLVQRFKPETKTASGLFLPSSATSSPLPEASVVSTGPGAPDKDGKVVPTSVKAGDKVLLPGWGGNSIKVGEEVSCNGNKKEGQKV